MKIAASHYGYESKIKLFPDKNYTEAVADIVLEKTSIIKDDDLFVSLGLRSSNRNKYSTDPISSSIKKELQSFHHQYDDISVHIVDEPLMIKNIAEAASKNEKVVLENKKLHEFLFKHITWSESEDSVKKGFFIKTLELKGPQKVAFKIFKNWKILQGGNFLGISNLVSKDNEKLYTQSSMITAFTVKQLNPESFVKIGMVLERFWLTATKHNLGVQPLAGITLLEIGVARQNVNLLGIKHISLIKDSYKKLKGAFNLKDDQEEIVMMLRVGIASPPSARTLRHNPIVTIKVIE
jgi:hypothetical protein